MVSECKPRVQYSYTDENQTSRILVVVTKDKLNGERKKKIVKVIENSIIFPEFRK